MAKGNNIMSNRKYTSDAVGSLEALIGSTVEGGDSMSADRDRKGGNIMSNARATSDMVGGYDIIGGCSGDVLIGSTDEGGDSMNADRDRKGGNIMSNARSTSDMVGGYDIIGAACGADDSLARVVAASQKIDLRISSVLRPEYGACYESAMNAGDRASFNAAANCLLMAMCGDRGVASMVTSVSLADGQFGGLGLLQRAMTRRLMERKGALGV